MDHLSHEEDSSSLPLPSMQDTLLPAIDLDNVPSNCNNLIGTLLQSLNMTSIPPHPTKPVFQRGGSIKVDLRLLHVDPIQLDAISKIYDSNQFYHAMFADTPESQQSAQDQLHLQGICIKEIGDLGNKWSNRWSKQWKMAERAYNVKRVLIQCQCGSSSSARKSKEDTKKIANNRPIYLKEWMRKMPFDFTGCLAHIDLTYDTYTFSVLRITGILDHNSQCQEQTMQRFPAVPVHPHVWEVALQQLADGASFTAIQEKNRSMIQRKCYRGQANFNPTTMNLRYELLSTDSSRLYRMHNRLKGVNFAQLAEYNVDNWLNPTSPNYQNKLHEAIFYYKARTDKTERLRICIHIPEMKTAAWKYAHNGQLILDGTFGVSDTRLLLFIALGIDDGGKGVPLAFFIFSAPTGNQATHAGYDCTILTELLQAWMTALGEFKGQPFNPKLIITDTDMKERAALHIVWPAAILLLCQFHVRSCWVSKRKTLIKMGKEKYNFHKEQVRNRLAQLEKSLISTSDYKTAYQLITAEREFMRNLSSDPSASSTARAGLTFLTYLENTWMPESLWRGWSLADRKLASVRLNIPVEKVVTTTNHLEAFNGVLKHKFIRNLQKGGRRLRFDLLIFLMVKQILPGIFLQRKIEKNYYEWLFTRFSSYMDQEHSASIHIGNKNIKPRNKVSEDFSNNSKFAWWPITANNDNDIREEVKYIIKHHRIGPFRWSDTYTLATTCASSLEDVNDPNHRRYSLYMNCYGWSICSCAQFHKTGLACKHLWAFREILRQLNPPYGFIFPTSHTIATQIYTALFPYLLIPQGVESVAPLTLSSSQPLPNILQVHEDLPSAVELLETWGEKEPAKDQDSSDSGDDGPLESVPNEENTNHANAIQHQIKAKLEHELKMLLPRLHGLYSLLQHSTIVTREAVPTLQELFSLTGTIQQFSLEDTPGISHSGTLMNSGFINNRKRRKSNEHPNTQALLPPSPERSQKRKPSNAIF